MKKQTLPKCLAAFMLIAFFPIVSITVHAQPQSGLWSIQSAFGEMGFTVNPEGTHITKLSLTFSDYTCGGVTQNGTVTKQSNPGWSITDDQFSIATSINPGGTISITIDGTFNQSGNEASGTWEIDVSGTICSGDWSHSLSNGTIPEGQWQGIGPYMGYINAMDMDNDHPDTVYAATPHGLYRTFNAAENWDKLNLPENEINNVVVSQKESNRILCTSEYKVYLSNDNGENWDIIFSDTLKIQCTTFNPENPNTILIGVQVYGFPHSDEIDFFYRSMDAGGTWEKVYFNGVSYRDFPYSIKYLIIDPSDTLKIYAGTENYLGGGMFVSHNNGVDWINLELAGSSENVYALACTPKGYETHAICAIASKHTAPDVFDRKLYISKDAGMTWEEKAPPSSFDLLDNVNYESTMNISEDFPEYINIGAEYKYEGGSSSVVAFSLEEDKWAYYPDAPNSFPTALLTCNERDYLGFSDKGVYRYEGDYIWSIKNKGFSSGEVLDLAPYPESPEKMLVAIENNLFKTNNLGLSWKKLKDTGWNRNSIFVNRNDTSKIIAGTDPNKYLTYGSSYYIYKSENGGESWNSQVLFTRYGNIQFDYKMWTGDMNGPSDNSEIVFIGIDGGDSSSGAGLYKSTDGGSSWNRTYTTGVSTIAVDPENNSTIYWGTTGLGYVFRSEDWGDNWTRISPGGQNAFVESVWDVEVDNKGQVFAATSSGLFVWEGDTTWTLNPGFPTTKTTALAVDHSKEDPVYYVGTAGSGVYRSTDGGSTWESYNDGLEYLNIKKLKIGDTFPKYLYAGTFDGGAWVAMVEESPVIETEEHIAICEGETYEGWTEAGDYQRTLTSSTGKDSIVTTHLTVNPTFEAEEYISICEGEEYLGLTEEGSHVREFETIHGCDSTVITHLTVNAVYDINEYVEICEGDSYQGWTEEGVYPVTYTSAFGCDSIVTINLSFYPSFKPAFTLEADTLTATETYSAYQWYDAGGAIAGATDRKLVISNSGEYHLEGTNEHGCTYASDAQYVIQTYVPLFSSGEFEFSVIPNPNHGIFLFRIDANPPENLSVRLVNGIGQVLETRILPNPSVNQTEQFNVSHLSSGIYHFVVISDKLRDTRKIVIQ